MVFATLSQKDKEAFFALLDEYFESRPHLFAGQTARSNAAVPSTTANATRTPARSIPAAHSPPASRSSTPPAIKPKVLPPATPTRKITTPRIVEPPSHQEDSDHENVDAAPVSVASRIAAAQAAIGASNNVGARPPVPVNRKSSYTPSVSSSATSATAPPPTPQRTPSTANSHGIKTPPPSTHTTGLNSHVNGSHSTNGSPSGLVSSKTIGNIDTSSAGAAVSSVFSSKKKSTGTGPGTYIAPKPAFEKPKTRDTFAPPPSRSPAAPQTNLSREEEPEEEEEEGEGEYAKGEWVEALYDFESAEGTDLSFKAGQQIFVTERSSKDWWMAELNGKEGLVPASYVKVL
ncbi:hypothetical protein FRC17_000108 [Serendipita sp. 399]|nr:hypothetical protein FRC17_000108 [Serendipita sp. 399]